MKIIITFMFIVKFTEASARNKCLKHCQVVIIPEKHFFSDGTFVWVFIGFLLGKTAYNIFDTLTSFLTKHLIIFLAIFQRVNAQAVQCQSQISIQKVVNGEVLLIVLKLGELKHIIHTVEQWLKSITSLVVDVIEVQNIEVRQNHTKKTIHSEDELFYSDQNSVRGSSWWSDGERCWARKEIHQRFSWLFVYSFLNLFLWLPCW